VSAPRAKFSIDDGGQVVCDVDTLVDTRMLIQSNSGGGKSWAVRRILESTHGKVQHLVLDPEGEYASLREEHDYVHAARVGGDTVAHPRSAALLAERLLELGVSAVLDLYELKAHERVRFVRLFLEALVEAPKKLWHPVLVVVDEAHVFCPQNGSAESAAAVIDLCSRGRKRGYSALLATQRIAKLHKDAAAELNNKLIGRTTLDVDLARASDELGFPKSRWGELREMEPGQFFATGPAFSKRGVVPVKVGAVFTTHPKAGARIAYAPPPPTSKIKALLPKLSDLPAEAEERAKTTEELRAEVTRLQRELAAKPKSEPKIVEVPIVDIETRRVLETSVGLLGGHSREMRDAANAVIDAAKRVTDALGRMSAAPAPAKPAEPYRNNGYIIQPGGKMYSRDRTASTADAKLGVGERSVLTAIAQHGMAGVDREQISVLTGYKRSTRDSYLQRLRTAGLINDGPSITATPDGVDTLGADFAPLPTGRALRRHWLDKLPEGERRLFDLILVEWPDGADREKLSRESGYKRSTRDSYLQRLSARKLIVANRGSVRASEALFTD